jgi:putative flippase GtrA
VWRLLRFGLAGATAALVHLCLVVGLVERLACPPLRANALGFAGAFLVSSTGQRYFTFADCPNPHRQALTRHLAVALGGWLLNQVLFALLLATTSLPYPLALALVLMVVAGLSFLLARRWVFY